MGNHGKYNTEKYIERMSSVKSNENNPRWNGGCRAYWTFRARKTLERKCGVSWIKMFKPIRAVIHHIDGNFRNDSFDNLCVMPLKEHNVLHKLGAKYNKMGVEIK